MWQQAPPIIGGIGGGLAIALLIAPSVDGFTFGTSPTDPVTLAIGAFGLLLMSMCAAAPSVRVATRIDPATVIRDA